MQSLTNVAVSALSRLKRNPIEYKRHLLSAAAVTAFVGMGVGTDLTLIGRDVIRVLLGPAWEPAGRIFTFFGPGIGVMFIYSISSWIHLSIGRADRWFRWTIVELAVTGLLFVLGLPWGPAGVAVAWTASFWILTIPALWYAGKPMHLGIGPVLAAVWKYFLASLLSGCVTAVITGQLQPFVPASSWVGALARIAVVSSFFGVLYIGAVVVLYRGCAPLYQVARLLRDMVPWPGSQEPRPATLAACGPGISEALSLAGKERAK